MTERDFLIYLDGNTRLCRYRHHHITKGKEVVEFSIQLEVLLDNTWYAAIRYDTSHGRPHQDVLHSNGTQTKKWLDDLSVEEALTYGHNDIMRNWQTYRDRFIKEFDK